MDPLTASDDLRRQAREHQAHGRIIPVLQALNGLIALGTATAADWRLAGNTLLSVREFAQAIGAFENAVLLDPGDAESHYGLASARFEMGDVSAAVRGFAMVAESFGSRNAWTSLATVIPGCPESGPDRVLDVRRRFGALIAGDYPPDSWQPPPSRGPRLRIGYVSAFFHRPNYMKPVWAMINGHDRTAFDVVLFADDTDASGLAWFTPGPGDAVHLTGDLDNAALVRLIRSEALDVLIDLNSYSAPDRLPVLTVRLARAGAAWFNLYATSGLPGIDWILGDDEVIPPHEEAGYSERVHRLPLSYLSFTVPHEAPPVTDPPCLTRGGFTFGSLVSQYKITPPVLEAWCAILHAAPQSRMVLANRALGSRANRAWMLAQFTGRGIAADRVEFLPPAEHAAFLRHYEQIDVALDAFPYNGGTTTTEALWQGVPVLTTAGDRWASRTSRSLLTFAGLEEWVAPDTAAFIATAARIAADPESPQRLAVLRRSLRARLEASPVCGSAALTAAIEDFCRNC